MNCVNGMRMSMRSQTLTCILERSIAGRRWSEWWASPLHIPIAAPSHSELYVFVCHQPRRITLEPFCLHLSAITFSPLNHRRHCVTVPHGPTPAERAANRTLSVRVQHGQPPALKSLWNASLFIFAYLICSVQLKKTPSHQKERQRRSLIASPPPPPSFY